MPATASIMSRYGEYKDEVKWIWTDTYEHVFPGQENKFFLMLSRRNNFLLCNHCETGLRKDLPDTGDIQEV